MKINWTKLSWVLAGSLGGVIVTMLVMSVTRTAHNCDDVVTKIKENEFALTDHFNQIGSEENVEAGGIVGGRGGIARRMEREEREILFRNSLRSMADRPWRRAEFAAANETIAIELTYLENRRKKAVAESKLLEAEIEAHKSKTRLKAALNGEPVLPSEHQYSTQRQQCGSWITTQPATQPAFLKVEAEE